MQVKQVKYGIYTWFGYVRPFEERLRMIKDAGFDSICTWWGDTFFSMDGKKELHAELAAKHDLVLEHAHLPYHGYDALWTNSLNGTSLAATCCKSIAAAADCGIRNLVMHPYENKRAVQNGDWQAFFYYMDSFADTADRYGIRLAIENLDECRIVKRILKKYKERAPIGLCFDTGHGNINEPGDFSLLMENRDRVYALHLHDNNGKTDQHLLPFEGSVNWGLFIKQLNKTAFSGSLMLEACYPFDFEKADKSTDIHYSEPPIAAEEYLDMAISACRRLK